MDELEMPDLELVSEEDLDMEELSTHFEKPKEKAVDTKKSSGIISRVKGFVGNIFSRIRSAISSMI